MARRYYAAWNSVALTAATAKTVLELPSTASVDYEIDEIFIGFDLTTAGSCVIELGTFTTTGTGTALTAQPYSENRVASLLTTGKIADTVEPTGFTNGTLGGTIRPSFVVPLPGYFAWQAALEQELYVPVSTNYGLRLTASAGCNTRGWIAWKE